MKYDKINNLLLSEDNEMSEQLSKFVTRQYVKVNSLSNTYNENKSIRFKTPMLRLSLCDYSDAYILGKVLPRLMMLLMEQKMKYLEEIDHEY